MIPVKYIMLKTCIHESFQYRNPNGQWFYSLYCQLPKMSSPEEMQKFFLQEVQNGEDLLAQGDVDGGIEHLSNAVAVCGQPHQLLQVLQQTLPVRVFQLLLQKLPTVSQRFANVNSSATVTEDELE